MIKASELSIPKAVRVRDISHKPEGSWAGRAHDWWDRDSGQVRHWAWYLLSCRQVVLICGS